ncbi:MAG: polymer-forming cytoskeletal protein [Steroidobacteraceae bacterium]
MSLWKEPAAPAPANVPRPIADAAPRAVAERTPPTPAAAPREPQRDLSRDLPRESVIAAGLAIEGKIQGSGHVRIAGTFKGDVQVEGNLSIDTGAKHHGEVRAATVTVSGELTGNISARHVDVMPSGVIVGDVKADTITVASGSRMRGHVEFGWGDAVATPARSESTLARIEPKSSGLPS